jgi:hypothetical protein
VVDEIYANFDDSEGRDIYMKSRERWGWCGLLK